MEKSYGYKMTDDNYFPLPKSGVLSVLLTTTIGLLSSSAGAYMLGMFIVHRQKVITGYQEIFTDFSWAAFITTTGVVGFLLGMAWLLLHQGFFRLYTNYCEWKEMRLRKTGYSQCGLYIGKERVEYRGYENRSLFRLLIPGERANGLVYFPLNARFSKEESGVGMPGGQRLYYLRIEYSVNGVEEKYMLKDFTLDSHPDKQCQVLTLLRKTLKKVAG